MIIKIQPLKLWIYVRHGADVRHYAIFYPSPTRYNDSSFPTFYYADSSIPVRQVGDWILYLPRVQT